MSWSSRWFPLAALAALAAGLAAGCAAPSDGAGEADTGGAGGGAPAPSCVVDNHNTPETAVPLVLSERLQEAGLLCPPRDEDWFSFTLPANRPLLTLEVAYPDGATSAVELAYELYEAANPTVPVATGTDSVTTDNRSRLVMSHYVSAAGGDYLLKVRDGGNEDQDGRNQYSILVTAGADSDANEPNDDCAHATPLTAAGGGAISYQGDRDAFSFSISGSRIVDLQLATAAQTGVDLQATLYDADGNFLTTVSDPFGGDGNQLRLRYGVRSERPLCLVVEDLGGDEADSLAPYTIALSVTVESDPNDQGDRNDTPATATPVASGSTTTGYILSQGDTDWFRVDAARGQIVQVEVSCDGCDYGLTVNLVYGEPDSPCAPGNPCDFSLAGACGPGDACDSGVCRETPEGKLCARECGDEIGVEDPDPGHLDCPSFQCQRTGSVRACVAGAVCLPDPSGGSANLCGVVQFDLTSDPGTSQLVRTAQPVLTDRPLFVVVHDYQDDEFADAPYGLRVTVAADPDPNERGGLNNFYLPYTDVADVRDALRLGRDLATDVPWTDISVPADPPPLPQFVASGEGCIGYQTDIDVFRLVGGNPCGTGQCGLQIQYDEAGGVSPMDLKYFLTSGGMSPVAGWLTSEQGGDRVFGDDPCSGTRAVECTVYSQDASGDYYLVVYDDGLDAWDLAGDHCYSFTITAAQTAGCPASCPVPYGGDGPCTCG